MFSAGVEFIKSLVGKQSQVKLIDLRLPGSLKIGPDDFLLESNTEELHKRLSKPRWEFGQVNKSSLHKDLNDDEVTAILKKSIYFQVGDHEKVFAICNEDLERETDVKTSAVHFMRFEFDQKMISAFGSGEAVKVGSSHTKYDFEITLDSESQEALSKDFN